MEQLNIFNELHEKFKIDNTNGVRLFEAFAVLVEMFKEMIP